MNNYITEINIDCDRQKLLNEFNSVELVPYTPSRPIKADTWFSYQPDWLTLTIKDYSNFPEIKKIKDLIMNTFKLEPIGKLFQLSKGVEIPPHKDMGHRSCINIVLSNDPAPVTYKNYGDVVYKTAILNVSKRHSVNAGPQRKVIKFQLGRLFYSDAVKIWNSKQLIM
jgi:hypothetical protein